MKEETHTIRELKSRHSFKCLWGKCPSCSRVIKGKGIHDVEVYQVFECSEEEECGNCGGDGYRTHECWECDGTGEVQETCEECKGKGKMPDEFGKRKFVKEVDVLVKKKNLRNS